MSSDKFLWLKNNLLLILNAPFLRIRLIVWLFDCLTVDMIELRGAGECGNDEKMNSLYSTIIIEALTTYDCFQALLSHFLPPLPLSPSLFSLVLRLVSDFCFPFFFFGSFYDHYWEYLISFSSKFQLQSFGIR